MPIITITAHGVQTFISVWDGAGTATIPGTIPGTTATDGGIPIIAAGTARGITAGGTHPGILPGTTEATMIPGTTVTAGGTEVAITAASTTDTTPV